MLVLILRFIFSDSGIYGGLLVGSGILEIAKFYHQ